jgi:16S rRNA (cytosine967-C5)-methyltransferase
MGARVTAWDARTDALHELRRRADRSRLSIEIAEPAGTYDVALVDAPCSGTGVLRRHPENRWKLEFPVEAQRALVADARARASAVVYATCSLALRENEAIVDGGTTRWPEEGGGEGFYVCVAPPSGSP